jgi:tetratricopeptide (TPR) repeat protein
VEEDFAKFAKETAKQMGSGLDWEKPDFKLLLSGTEDLAQAAWAKTHPTNFYVMSEFASALMEEKKWAEAKPVLQKLVELYPDSTGPDSTYRLLAAAHRGLGESNEERQVLARLTERDDAAPDACQRLLELAAAAKDWPAVMASVRRYLGINPLLPLPYRFLAEASEALDQPKPAIEAYQALLQLDPPNPAEVHFKLARQLHRVNDPTAKRHLLQSLEEAPRYRDALQLLFALNQSEPVLSEAPATPPVTANPSPVTPR